MDAYDIKNKIAELWQRLSKWPSASDIKKQFIPVPVYVSVEGKMYKVKNIKEQDSNIVLEIENE
jgi:hypothetical protein